MLSCMALSFAFGSTTTLLAVPPALADTLEDPPLLFLGDVPSGLEAAPPAAPPQRLRFLRRDAFPPLDADGGAPSLSSNAMVEGTVKEQDHGLTR
mmetsp:Transcript_32076/g.74935  ORF Transcript_32076/g.74935 Transcript_32076/m.74935 type:complete len:95 (+) Transcript_32076:812-1096(+)